jgi:cholesterol transport system auxiliary component
MIRLGLLGAGLRALSNAGLSASVQRPEPGAQRRKRCWFIGTLLSNVALVGCTGSLLETDLPAASIYVIAPAQVAPAQAGAQTLAVDLSIGSPQVAPGLDTNRIAVLRGRQLDYYRAASWGGSTLEVVQTFLVNSLEDQQLFRSVTAEQARVAGDYVLDVEVRDFQAEYANEGHLPVVRVKMIGRLIRIIDRELVSTVAAEAQNPASADRMHAIAAAFETTAQQVALELAQKTAAAVAGDEPSLSAARGVRTPDPGR